jgi:hypothetical protein
MSPLDTLFGTPRSKSQQKGRAQTIKGWVRELFAPASDTVIMITEKDCRAPKCPGIETVIAVIEYRRVQRLKISKPMIEVTQADIVEAIGAGNISMKADPAPSSSP